MLKDGVVLEDSGGRIVINQYSFCELIKHLLTHYVKISYENASEIVSQSHLVTPISSAIDARLLNHEYPSQPNDMTAYFELENSIIT